MKQERARCHVGPVGVAYCYDLRWVEAVHLRGCFHELGQLVRAEQKVLVIEDPFCETAEKAWGAELRDLAPGGEDGRSGGKRLCESDEVFLVTSRTVQQEDCRARLVCARQIAVDETQVGAHALSPAGRCSGGRTSSSLSRRVSSQGGSLRRSPRCSWSSSTPKPGGSVAISKRTPPGSRK